MSWDTTWSGLGEPTPRPQPARYELHAWPSGTVTPLEPLPPTTTALSVFGRRQSHRSFGPVTDAKLSALLWAIAARKQAAVSPMGFSLERRGVPSAGAIHPVHILVCDPSRALWQRYDGERHAFHGLGAVPAGLLSACAAMVPWGQGRILFFAAEPGMTAAKYNDAVSLVLRDAGVLQGCAAIAAEALDLSFCLLGLTGDPWVSALSQEGKLRGVGAALVGSRA